MKEGYWINYRTGKVFDIDEHEQWLRRGDNAKKLGLPDKTIEAMKTDFEPKTDRDKLLIFVMKSAPVMRVRGHGNYVTFEYASRSHNGPMDEVWLWGKKNAGPFTGINIVNLATREDVYMNWKDFKETMDRGGASEVMRVASRKFDWPEGTVKELIALSRELLGEEG